MFTDEGHHPKVFLPEEIPLTEETLEDPHPEEVHILSYLPSYQLISDCWIRATPSSNLHFHVAKH